MKVSGEATGREFLECLFSYGAHPDFRPDFDMLYDVPASVEISVQEEGVMSRIEDAIRDVRGDTKHRVAGVLRSSAHETFFRAAVAMLSPASEFETFQGASSALVWLGIEEEGSKRAFGGGRAPRHESTGALT